MDTSDSEKFILELNFRNEIINEKNPDSFFDIDKTFDLLPETIIDKRTLQMLEVKNLYKALDHTMTYVGSARLFHSLMNPSESIELIHAKHDSFCELASNEKLQNAISDFLESFSSGEKNLFKFINAHMSTLLIYRDFNNAMGEIEKMLAMVKKLPRPETIYLDSLFQSIMSFEGSSARRMVAGPIFRTLDGLVTRKEKGVLTPSLRFRPGRISGGTIAPLVPGMFFGLGWLFEFMNTALAGSLFVMSSMLTIIGPIYGSFIKPVFDYESAVLPFRKRLLESNRFVSAIEAVAALDELFSFFRYTEEISHPTVLPDIVKNDVHFFAAEELRNPIRAKEDPDFVANDISLDGSKVTFITGPNSGGKTTYCKTIAQTQLLGQIGAPVVAKNCRMSMADSIAYQAPAFDSLLDMEGRFGTELKLTRDIFFSVTPRSLAILDEIAEGTTTHEKMNFSVDILNGFHTVGNNTLMVTHSFELVENFMKQGKGQYLQVEIDGETPTHRIIEGISKESHAKRVAEKIGFSKEDIQKHLADKGYIDE